MQRDLKLIELDKNNLDHVHTLYAVRTHAEVDKYLRGNPPANFADHVTYLNRIGDSKKFFLIEVENSLCGYCQLTIFDEQIEFGMALHPHSSNRGIGSQAMAQLLTIVQEKEVWKDKPLILFVKADNPRALALYRKYGFQCEGDVNEYGEHLMKKVSTHVTAL